MILRIANLDAACTGSGFVRGRGRHPTVADCGLVEGPLDIVCSGESGRILAIEPSAGREIRAGETTIDGRGRFATAGWIDAHTHALFAGDRSSEFFQRWAGLDYATISASGGGIHRTMAETAGSPDAELEQELVRRLEAMVAGGVTTIEVKSGYGGTPAGELRLLRIIHRVRRQFAERGIRVKSTFLGLHALPRGQTEAEYAEAMTGLLPVVMREGLCDFADAFPERGFFSLDVALRFLQAASQAGLGIRVHADELSPMGAALAGIRAGALSVDHLERAGAGAAEALARADTVAVLLPSTALYLGLDDADARGLIGAGARVALATDFNPGTAPHPGLRNTLVLGAARLRMSAPELLAAVTYNAAAALGLEGDVGALLAGWRADIALWPGSGKQPSAGLLESLVLAGDAPSVVIAGGRVVRRDAASRSSPS